MRLRRPAAPVVYATISADLLNMIRTRRANRSPSWHIIYSTNWFLFANKGGMRCPARNAAHIVAGGPQRVGNNADFAVKLTSHPFSLTHIWMPVYVLARKNEDNRKY